MYHPVCVGFPGNVNPQSVKWWCQACAQRPDNDTERLVNEGLGSLSNLNVLGKRRNGNEFEEEINPGKKFNIGINGMNYS